METYKGRDGVETMSAECGNAAEVKQKQVEGELNVLRMAIGDLEKQFEFLINRLVGVLSESKENINKECVSPVQEHLVPLAGVIRMEGERIVRIRRAVVDVISCLEL